jgi:hypothetical protein
MDYFMNSAGISVPCIREYEIETDENLKKGTIMTLSSGAAAKASGSDTVLGILAEDYNTEKDQLNPRSGSGRARIIVSPGTICRQPLCETVAEENATATSLKINGYTVPSEANSFKGGYIKLVYKAETSENADFVGKTRKITASSNDTLTVESGGIPNTGDIYAILPPAGFSYIALASDGTSFDLSSSKSSVAQIVSCMPENDYCEIGFLKTFFN